MNANRAERMSPIIAKTNHCNFWSAQNLKDKSMKMETSFTLFYSERRLCTISEAFATPKCNSKTTKIRTPNNKPAKSSQLGTVLHLFSLIRSLIGQQAATSMGSCTSIYVHDCNFPKFVFDQGFTEIDF